MRRNYAYPGEGHLPFDVTFKARVCKLLWLWMFHLRVNSVANLGSF